MAVPVKIRINNITGRYEHWVQINNQNGYWADTTYESSVPVIEVITNFLSINDSGTIQLYDEFDNPSQTISVQMKTFSVSDQNRYLDTSIYELLDPEVSSSSSSTLTVPEVGNIYLPTNPEINSETGFKIMVDSNFILSVYTNSTNDISDTNTLWFENGKSIFSGSIDPIELVYEQAKVEKDLEEKVIECKVENIAGISEAPPMSISVYNPFVSKFFNKNLIKNGDASDGLSKWIVSNGTPKTYPGWDNFNRTGFFNQGMLPELRFYDSKFPDQLTMRYFMGGEATPDNAETTMYQIIDVSEISDLIDKKVSGVEDGVYANLFGLFGKRGTTSRPNVPPNSNLISLPFATFPGQGYLLPGLNNNVGHYHPLAFYFIDAIGDGWHTSCRVNYHVGDRSKLKIIFLDKSDNEISSIDNILRTDNFIGVREQVWMRRTTGALPIGTRKIKAEVKFEKDFGITIPSSYSNTFSISGFTPSEITSMLNPGTMYNVRPWEEKPGSFTFYVDHLSMVTFLNLELGIIGKITPHSNIPLNTQINGQFPSEIYNRPQTLII